MKVVLLVGPDGVGKSSLARLLAADAQVRRQHYRPVATRPGSVTDPHGARPRSFVLSLAKIVYLWVEQWRVHVRRRFARCDGVVVVERGFWDQAVDPRRYRLPPRSTWFVHRLAVLLPRPQLTVLLSGPPALVAERKAELSPTEIDRQLVRWRVLLPQVSRRTLELDVTQPLDELARRVRERLDAP